jgi:glucosamine--fructose-6-phosphate aminotransferase (isomerizing)
LGIPKYVGAGEMKHGPIALISEECPTVALCANKATAEKMHSNLMEVKSRNGPVIAVVTEGVSLFDDVADAILFIPKTLDELSVVPATVVTQLFAYFIARKRGLDIDQPRNLAKSVTVE